MNLNRAYLLLGSNMNDRVKLLNKSRALIRERVGEIIASSSVYETEPWGFEAGMNFLNQALLVGTRLSPQELLYAVLEIEIDLGRIRDDQPGYRSRTMDIDILFFNDLIILERDLEIPHPRLHERRFALVPMNDIQADLVHPVLRKSVAQLLDACQDTTEVKEFNPENNPTDKRDPI